MTGDKDKKWKKSPALAMLMKAFEEKKFDEYLYYEVILPKYPGIVYYTEREFVEDMAKYVVNVRGKG
jgi:hypothetical protein